MDYVNNRRNAIRGFGAGLPAPGTELGAGFPPTQDLLMNGLRWLQARDPNSHLYSQPAPPPITVPMPSGSLAPTPAPAAPADAAGMPAASPLNPMPATFPWPMDAHGLNAKNPSILALQLLAAAQKQQQPAQPNLGPEPQDAFGFLPPKPAAAQPYLGPEPQDAFGSLSGPSAPPGLSGNTPALPGPAAYSPGFGAGDNSNFLSPSDMGTGSIRPDMLFKLLFGQGK
jgi:hypothetical protein